MGVTLYFQDEARVAHSIFMWLGICLCFTIGILSTRTITKKAFVPVKGSAFVSEKRMMLWDREWRRVQAISHATLFLKRC
mmetsp:Transcript_9687/g.13382  ORF Transcript_9687/g.13382 Transcript_9687/m.13382 type:complete len:80 (+) Transcript_9687:124-363(+)